MTHGELMAIAAEARKAEAEALRYAMEQEAEGIRAKGLAEAEAIEKKAEAQKKMGEASVLEMYLNALPEVVKNAATPLAKTDKIVMYGDGNSTKLVRDVMNSTDQVIQGVKETTGIDLMSMLAGFVGCLRFDPSSSRVVSTVLILSRLTMSLVFCAQYIFRVSSVSLFFSLITIVCSAL